MKKFVLAACLVTLGTSTFAQNYVSKVWVSDQGNGTYKNPVLDADYSDPDVCRVGNDFYMTASSFDAIPGLPILHSKDLVNWKLIGHALTRQFPLEHFSKIQHGNGVWAPAIRYHKGEFYIYYGDPDFGIYVLKAKKAEGPWSEPILVQEGKGLIDTCPFWDEDGQAYLVHGWAGSRAGIKSVLTIKKMSPDGTKILEEGTIIYDGHIVDPTIEGPKMHKRNGYYYVFAPAGGVSTGWQVVLRSKNPYGPYERKVVMAQGKSSVNGPHQGAWVDTPNGENWFLHFQDKGIYGRVVHMQPMKWVNNWPVIGIDEDGDGSGDPVMIHKKPNVGKVYPIETPAESDEFNNIKMGLQWQWQANPQGIWHSTTNQGVLRLYSYKQPEEARNLREVPNVLLQKFPTEEFMATTKLVFTPNDKLENEKTGLVVMGKSFAYIGLKSTKDGLKLVYSICEKANTGASEQERVIANIDKDATVYLRTKVFKGGKTEFSYSLDGSKFITVSPDFSAVEGHWIGAKVGIFCTRTTQINDSGYADYDWFRVDKISE